MKINIISIGHFKNKDPYLDLFNEYKKRIGYNINLIEVKNIKSNNIEEQKKLEGIELLNNTTKGNKLVVLDERGEIITTNNFEKIFTKYTDCGFGIDFVIGGSDGLSQNVLDKADYVLSLSKMVFPHLMVRVILIEQLYRVFTLKNGHPYHK